MKTVLFLCSLYNFSIHLWVHSHFSVLSPKSRKNDARLISRRYKCQVAHFWKSIEISDSLLCMLNICQVWRIENVWSQENNWRKIFYLGAQIKILKCNSLLYIFLDTAHISVTILIVLLPIISTWLKKLVKTRLLRTWSSICCLLAH